MLHMSVSSPMDADLIPNKSAMHEFASCAALHVSGVGFSTPESSFLAWHYEVEVGYSTRTIVRNLPSIVCQGHK